jgi:branched-chain amino acid transport system ATP-binding protein
MATLSVRDVSLSFGGITALDGISFDVEPRQICGLIGPNGAGKTSLFNCVSRIYQPSSGAILLDGDDLLAHHASGIARKGVARTFQNLGLFPSMTLLENTMAGAYAHGRVGFTRALVRWGVAREERALRAEAYELLERLDLAQFALQHAEGLPFGTLKRLELARALAARPKLLMLDEPAGGLTHGEVHELGEMIRRVREDFELTVLLVEHHMGLVMGISDKVVAMANGKKVAEGTPRDIQVHPEVVSAYLGTPV